MKDRDAYILLLEEKLKGFTGAGDVRQQLAEVCDFIQGVCAANGDQAQQRIVEMEGKIQHLAHLHKLGQDLFDSEEQEYPDSLYWI